MKDKYIYQKFSWLIWFVLTFTACKQEVVQPAGLSSDGLISFFNVSSQFTSDAGSTGRGYVLIDRVDTNFKFNPLAPFEFPYLIGLNKFQYPTTAYNASLVQPWVQYLHLKPGQHTLVLVDTSRYLRSKTTIALTPNLPASVYYADSIGYFRPFVLHDRLNSENGKAGLRFLDCSPDAGNIFFTINEKPASQSGFPATMHYGTSSSFVSYPNPQPDTLRINFFSVNDSTTVIARAFVQAAPSHSYTLVLWGYNNSFISYPDPKNGTFRSINGGLSVLINQNN